MSKNSRHDFRCVRCNAPACYGEGVFLLKGEPGRWYCAKHVPAGFLPGTAVDPVPPSQAAQGRLL